MVERAGSVLFFHPCSAMFLVPQPACCLVSGSSQATLAEK